MHPAHALRDMLSDGTSRMRCVIPLACSPSRADLVAALGETTGEGAFTRMRSRMQRNASGRDLLQLRPRMTVGLFSQALGLSQ